MTTLFRIVLIGMLAGSAAGKLQAQTAGDWAWKPLFEHRGVAFEYIIYRRANNEHYGLVLKLANTNAYAVDYHFDIVFRSRGAERVETAVGHLGAGEVKTGDAEGLFWIPFSDDRPIGEVGIRGYEVVPRSDPSPSARQEG